MRFLSDLEAGKGNISVLRLANVARALDVELVSLMPSEEKHTQTVTLVGLRGAGKSTIGKALAKHLRVPFVELDVLIEKESNLSLGELFSLHGEAYYKRLAYDAVIKLFVREEPMVLSTGGSIVTDPRRGTFLNGDPIRFGLKQSPKITGSACSDRETHGRWQIGPQP